MGSARAQVGSSPGSTRGRGRRGLLATAALTVELVGTDPYPQQETMKTRS